MIAALLANTRRPTVGSASLANWNVPRRANCLQTARPLQLTVCMLLRPEVEVAVDMVAPTRVMLTVPNSSAAACGTAIDIAPLRVTADAANISAEVRFLRGLDSLVYVAMSSQQETRGICACSARSEGGTRYLHQNHCRKQLRVLMSIKPRTTPTLISASRGKSIRCVSRVK